MFIRIKKIKNQEYAYLVKNIWRKRKKSSRQKTIRYLGKVHKLDKIKNKTLGEFLKIENLQNHLEKSNHEKTIQNLIKLELHNHNFNQISRHRWILKDFKINLREKTLKDTKTKKNVCLEMNNNFLCSYTLSKLLNFKPKKGLTELQIGKQLANSFESAGILVPKEIFVIIAKKILNETKRPKH